MLGALASVLPARVLFYVLYPASALRCLKLVRTDRDFPARHFPPRAGDPRPGFLRRWHYQASMKHYRVPLLWADRWLQSGWAKRLTSDGEAVLTELSAERPIIGITIHTRALFYMGPWLMSRGLGVGSVIIRRDLWFKPENVRRRSDPRWEKYTAESGAFLAGDTRQMIRYLGPKRVLLLPADHGLGHTAFGTWPGGRLRLATGGLRMARMTGAAVVPMVVTDVGPWRFHVHIGTPLPDELLNSGNDEDAVAEIARQLMPLVEGRPFQAQKTLTEVTSAV